MSYDIGYTRHDTLRFAAAESDYALYLITAPTAAEAAKEFRQLIGPSYIPPKWAFLPYLYSEFMKAALEDAPYFRPLAFDYPADPDAREVEDQLLLGEGLMIAPIYTQNAHGRTVYLPEPMKLLRLRSSCDYDEEVLPAGRHYLACELDEVLLFLPSGPHGAGGAACRQHFSAGRHRLTFWHFSPDGQPVPYPDVHRRRHHHRH